MDTSLHLFEDEKTPLTVELAAAEEEGSEKKPKGKIKPVLVSVDRIEKDKTGNRKLLVSCPPLVETIHAGSAVNLLMDRWDNKRSFLHTLTLSGVRFTKGGVDAMTNFLGKGVIQSMEQVILHNVIRGEMLEEDENSVFKLCKTLKKATNLESIDLSHNAIGGYIWQALGKQVKLKHLSLSDVEMDDASFQGLRSQFACGATLQSFALSNRTKTGKWACQVLDEILTSCRNLQSFVWEQPPSKKKFQDNLPLTGLAMLSKNMFKNDCHYMSHLELIGGFVPVDPTMLCNALEGFHKLQFLKLSKAHLNSGKIQRIVTALRSARPPLSTIDFSHNQIDCEGASWIAQLSCLRAVTKNLRLLNLEHNHIAQKGALEVVESFASKSSEFDLKLDGNAFDPCKMFLWLASSKYTAETEVKDLRKDCDRLRAEKTDAQSNLRELLHAQSAMINDMSELKTKAKQLEEDKDSLVKAFGVLGMMRHVEERDNILTRLAQLEETVHGKAPENGIKNGKNGSLQAAPRTARTKESPQPTRRLARRTAKSLDEALEGRKGKASRRKSFDGMESSPTKPTVPSTRDPRDRSSNGSPTETLATVPSSRDPSFRDHSSISNMSHSSMSHSSNNNSLSRSARAPGRRGSARNLLVRAASERWKSLMVDPDEEVPESRGPKKKPMRSKSSKSLAEFLNRSAPDGFGDSNHDSFTFDDRSVQTAPFPRSLGGARRRIREGQMGSSSRSLQGTRDQTGSSSRSLQVSRDQSKSPQSALLPPLDKMTGESSFSDGFDQSLTDF